MQQQTFFSTENGPIARFDTSSLDEFADYGPSLLSYRSNEVQNFSENSYLSGAAGQPCNFMHQAANQISYENVDDFAN